MAVDCIGSYCLADNKIVQIFHHHKNKIMIKIIKQNWKLLCAGAGIGIATVHLTDGRFTWAIIALACGLAMFFWQYLLTTKS